MMNAKAASVRPRHGLFHKYTLIFAAMVSGALLVSGIIDLFFSYRDKREALAELQRERAMSAAAAIEQFIHDVERQVGVAASTSQPPGKSGLTSRRRDYIGVLKYVPAITEISYIDGRGHEQVRVSRIALDAVGGATDRSESPQYREAKARKIYRSPVYFRNESEPYLTVAVAEQRPDGGVVVAEVNLKFIWEVVSRIRVSRAGHAYAVDSTGIVVAHPDISLALRNTDLSAFSQVRSALGGAPGANRQGNVTIAMDSQGHGQTVLTTHQPIAPLGWHVFVEQPLREAFAPLYSSIRRTALLMLFGLALAVLASLALARRLVTPVRALQESAALVGAGALEQSVVVDTGDELEALADEFNRMTLQLRDSYSNLEQKVEERTQELAKINTALASEVMERKRAEEALLQVNLKLEEANQTLEDRVRERTEALESSNRELEAFSYSVSHDLRAPLRSIEGFSLALLEDYHDRLDATGKDYLQRVRAASQRMTQLIDDLLNLSRLMRGEMSVEPVDLSGLVQSIMSDLKARDPGRQVEFVVQEGLVTQGDTRLVRVALENLLDNAFKFTGAHARALIEFGSVPHNGKPAYFVRDDGAGFDMSYCDKLFGVFQRLHGADQFEGTGIGLATAQRIIDRHGGLIWAEGEVEKGATFYFTL